MERTEFDRFFDNFEAIDLANFSKSLKAYHDQFGGMTYEQVMDEVDRKYFALLEQLKEEVKAEVERRRAGNE